MNREESSQNPLLETLISANHENLDRQHENNFLINREIDYLINWPRAL